VRRSRRGSRRRARLVAGGLLGGALVLVDRRRRRARPAPGGLRAFEDAPCYRESQQRDDAKPKAEKS